MKAAINRRRFLGSAVASGAFTIVPRHVLGGSGFVAPNDRINLAHIGMGTQGFNELGTLLEAPEIQIVAVCDPNRDSSDYVEWSKHSTRNRIRRYLDNPSWRQADNGCPGGREVGREVVDTYYTRHRGQGKLGGCRTYADFRTLLAEEKDLDAVKIMTPDHLHATISIAAMKEGKHVLMHKPIANRLIEGRKVIETARQSGVATHLLAYGSGARNGRIVEQIKEGVIGPLREVHNWSNRPVWPQYTEIPRDNLPIPDGFDWDLWLGPALPRPYHPNYTHTVFRGWYDFGGGSMADMGIYSLWPVFTGLNLGAPLSAQARATHTCTIVDGVSKTKKNDFSYPTACSIRLSFAARQNMPALELFWYDGGMKPRLPEILEVRDLQMKREGILFVGDQGCILADFRGRNAELFTSGGRRPLQIDDSDQSPQGPPRKNPWIQACLEKNQSPGSFLNAGSITDAVNLGTVALRAGRKVLFDSENLRITNLPEANKYLVRDYREGWEL
jgi:predicted dehydrogenase